MSVLRSAVIGLAVVAIIWPSVPPTAQTALPGSAWRVIEIAGQTAAGAGTLRFTQTSVRGKAGCNSFMGAFRETGGMIEIAGLGVTRMLCGDRTEAEDSVVDALGRAKAYKLEGAILVLLDAAGTALLKLAD